MKIRFVAAILFCALAAPVAARAQFAPPNAAGVTLAQIHLIVTDLEAHKQFWTTIMGGKIVERGAFTIAVFPEVFVFLEKGQPTGPSSGAVLDHFGFGYRDVAAQLEYWKTVKADVHPGGRGTQGYVWGPDGIRVEYASDPSLPVSFRMDHLHMHVPDTKAAQDWYEKNFGGRTGQRERNAAPGLVECSYFDSTTLSYNPLTAREGARLLPTKGRVIDRFGFDVADLKAFVARLTANGITIDVPPHLIPNTQTWSASVTDPLGDAVEITQNLASLIR